MFGTRPVLFLQLSSLVARSTTTTLRLRSEAAFNADTAPPRCFAHPWVAKMVRSPLKGRELFKGRFEKATKLYMSDKVGLINQWIQSCFLRIWTSQNINRLLASLLTKLSFHVRVRSSDFTPLRESYTSFGPVLCGLCVPCFMGQAFGPSLKTMWKLSLIECSSLRSLSVCSQWEHVRTRLLIK